MVTDQETNKVYFSTWLTKLKCWQDIRMTLEQARVPYGLLEGTQDYWVRDFMPIQVTRNSYVQYVYNPDYLHTSPDYRTDGVAFRTAKSSRRILSWTEAMSSNVTIQLS